MPGPDYLQFKSCMESNRIDLYHHGILGQKWGVRRFQPYPKDYKGSGKEVGEATKVKQRKKKESDDYIKTKELRKRKASSLTNEELKQINERMRLEREYNTYKQGDEYIKKFLVESGGKIVGTALTAGVFYVGYRYIKKSTEENFAKMMVDITSKLSKEAITNIGKDVSEKIKNESKEIRKETVKTVRTAAKTNKKLQKGLNVLDAYGKQVDKLGNVLKNKRSHRGG